MQKKMVNRNHSINCIFNRINTYKKDIYDFNKISQKNGGHKGLLEEINSIKNFKIAGSLDSIEEIETSYNSNPSTLSSELTRPIDYLYQIKKHVSEEIISNENYMEIENLANYFKNNITSFFGFETNLASEDSRSDYLFAVSAKKGEREELLNLLHNNDFSNQRINESSWKNITEFTEQWSEQNSILNENVLGLWFEFDTSATFSGLPVPNIFFQTKKLRIDSIDDEKKFSWITEKAIPTLIGKNISKGIEQKLVEAIKKLPKGTSVFHFGAMLSRKDIGIRIVINRIKPNQVIPYLSSIGWKYEKRELAQLLNELSKYISRIILHININEEVDAKIGIECSFSFDKYHTETEWEKFLEYLEKHNLCLESKKEALLNFIGAELDQTHNDFTLDDYIPSVMVNENTNSSALVRYLSHIKIVYNPNNSLIAKAYPGVRLLRSI